MEKRWRLVEADNAKVQHLRDTLQVNEVFCRLLVARGIETYDEAKDFFRITEDQLHDPFLMKDMDKAVERIRQALDEDEKILLYGDYDVDGTSAVAVVLSFFNHFSPHLMDYYIPNRFSEGYGLSEQGIQYAVDHGIKLLITLDCGIKSVALIEKAKAAGIDTIICDHHLPGDLLPDAIAILNPKQGDCPYPYKELCGCGIGYKLISAYAQRNHLDEHLINENLDLVATAVAADIVPITEENRAIAYMGLEKANHRPSLPIRALKEVGGLQKEMTIRDLVFIIAPRVNAAGRMDNAKKAVQLFIEKNNQEARNLAFLLDFDNKERVSLDRSITESALAHIDPSEKRYTTVVYNQDWHKGVVGIVASRLMENYYRPTIVLTESNGLITGSARSIRTFNLFEGLSRCSDLLENFGGHFFAAGLTLLPENLEAFKERFEQIVRSSVTEDELIPTLDYDAQLEFNLINFRFLKTLEEFAPHGPGNNAPVFITHDVLAMNGTEQVFKDKHLKMKVVKNGIAFNGVGFHLAGKKELIENNRPFSIAYHIERNHWRDRDHIQLRILDIQ